MKSRKKLEIDKLLTEVLNLLTRHEPRSLTFSKVSRWTGVPRSTLYYYFGNSPKAMIEEAIRFGMKAFTRFASFETHTRHRSWDTYQRERLEEVLRLIRRYPWGPALYFQYRNNLGEFGDAVREYEDRYCEKTAEAWKRFHGTDADPRSVRLAGYLKLGLLWGLSLEKEIWLERASKPMMSAVLDGFSEMLTTLTGQKLPQSVPLEPRKQAEPAASAEPRARAHSQPSQ